jgi:hypothetical protein
MANIKHIFIARIDKTFFGEFRNIIKHFILCILPRKLQNQIKNIFFFSTNGRLSRGVGRWFIFIY